MAKIELGNSGISKTKSESQCISLAKGDRFLEQGGGNGVREYLGCILESRTIRHGHGLDAEVQIINN